MNNKKVLHTLLGCVLTFCVVSAFAVPNAHAMENIPPENTGGGYNEIGEVNVELRNADIRVTKETKASAFAVNQAGVLSGYTKADDPNYPNVIIPESVGGVTVTSIGYQVFRGNGLESVEIPDTVTVIGGKAFENCPLTSVTIPDKVTSIGNEAFKNCPLTSVAIPDSVTSIGMNAFYNNKLESVKLPSTLQTLEAGVFYKNKPLTHIDIPDSVTTIRNGAFEGCGLTSIDLPDGLQVLQQSAFMNNDITSVVIPGTVTTWGNYIFCNNALTSVVIEEGVTEIPQDFVNLKQTPPVATSSNAISSVTLPSTLTKVETLAFYGGRLLYVDLPANVTTLGDRAFSTQVVTMDYYKEASGITINLPAGMNLAKLSILTPDVTVDGTKHTLRIPDHVNQITYQYALGTFNGVERFLDGTIKLGTEFAKIRFLDFDGSVLEEIDTVPGGAVTPSKEPARNNYTFIGWDKPLDNLAHSQDITAQYKLLPKISAQDRTIKVGEVFDALEGVSAKDAEGNTIEVAVEGTVDTSTVGTYSLIYTATDKWGGQSKRGVKVHVIEEGYSWREVTDSKTNIEVSGLISDEGRIIVELIEDKDNELIQYVDDKQLIVGSYEVRIIGEYTGKLKIAFPIDKQYEGNNVYIKHLRQSGAVEDFTVVSKNEKVSIEVDELSPFLLTIDKKEEPTPGKPAVPDKPADPGKPAESATPNRAVHTGDASHMAWYAIYAILALGIVTAIVAVRVSKGKSKGENRKKENRKTD